MTPHTRRKLIHYWRRHVRPILVLILVFTACRSSLVDWNDVPTGSMQPTIFVGDRIFVNKLAYGFKVPYTTWHLKQWSAPKAGEVVIFYSPEDGTRLVKRVIAGPGDRVVSKNGRLTITHRSSEPQTVETVEWTPFSPPADFPLPKDQVREYVFYKEKLGDSTHVIALRPDRWVEHVRVQSQMRGLDPDPSKRDFDLTIPKSEEGKEDLYLMMGDNRDNSRDSRWIGLVPRGRILGRANRVIFSLDYDDMYLPRKDRFFKELP
jgi:signal peptidase I